MSFFSSSTSSLGGVGGGGVKINLGDETYVSGSKSYCTWLSVEIKHIHLMQQHLEFQQSTYSHNSIEVVHTFFLLLIYSSENTQITTKI